MKIHLIAIGQRPPDWVRAGYAEYAKRLPPQCQLNLVEISAAKRSKSVSPRQAAEAESARMRKATPSDCTVIALDERGKPWTTNNLAAQLKRWMASGRDTALLVGGADGLGAECLSLATDRWSLSALTFPHALVRIVVAEQIYRAWTVLQNHPYHRGDSRK